MHIAICDDNVADRKQSERLMGREADKWIAKGKPLYVYSFGSVASLLDNSMKFDAILLDIAGGSTIDFEKAILQLSAKGVDGVIIYSNPEAKDVCENVGSIFLPKPIVQAGLHEAIEHVEKVASSRVSLIELRGGRETLYVREEEILYAVQSGEYTEVTLTENRHIKIHGLADTLYDEIRGKHDNFVSVSYSVVANIRHVDYVGPLSLHMSDGTILRAGRDVRAYVKHKKE